MRTSSALPSAVDMCHVPSSVHGTLTTRSYTSTQRREGGGKGIGEVLVKVFGRALFGIGCRRGLENCILGHQRDPIADRSFGKVFASGTLSDILQMHGSRWQPHFC